MAEFGFQRMVWPANYPEVVIHAELESHREAHRDFVAAKSGDPEAAARLVDDLLSQAALQRLKQLVGPQGATLAAVSALESRGLNAIPDAMANAINQRLGWPLDLGQIRQSNKVMHTRASTWHRYVTPAEFVGRVEEGARYVLVDDHVGFGGTLANLRGYLHHHGARVIAMTALTETSGARTIGLRQETLQALRERHGDDLEKLWQTGFGFGLECCTELEAAYLGRQQSVDYIRRRLTKAAKRADKQGIPTVTP